MRYATLAALFVAFAWLPPAHADEAFFFRHGTQLTYGQSTVSRLVPLSVVNGSGDLAVLGPDAIRAPSGSRVFYQMAAPAGGGGVRWTSVGAQLPPGLNLNSDGSITGAATNAGTYGGIVAQATDATGRTGTTAPFQIVIGQPVVTLDPGVTEYLMRIGDGFSLQGRASGMIGKASWSLGLEQGGMPSGLNLDTTQGNLLGIIGSASEGRFHLTATGQDSIPGTSPSVHLTTAPALTLGGISSAYTMRLGASFATGVPIPGGVVGSPSYGLDIVPPAGTRFEGGRLSGTPAQPLDTMAALSMSDDWDGRMTVARFRLLVLPTLSVSGASASSYAAREGVSFSPVSLSAQGISSAANAIWSASGLPGGLTISSTGTVSGTPDASGRAAAYPASVILTDKADGTSATSAMTFQVAQSAIPILPAGPITLANQDTGDRGNCTSIRLDNKGSAALAGLAASLSPAADFQTCAASTVPCGGSLSGGSTCNLGVQLKSTTNGPRSGNLSVTSANGLTPTISVGVKGTVTNMGVVSATTTYTDKSNFSLTVPPYNTLTIYVEGHYGTVAINDAALNACHRNYRNGGSGGIGTFTISAGSPGAPPAGSSITLNTATLYGSSVYLGSTLGNVTAPMGGPGSPPQGSGSKCTSFGSDGTDSYATGPYGGTYRTGGGGGVIRITVN